MTSELVRTSARLCDLVDRVYVINLPHRTDRRAESLLELDRHGFGDAAQIEIFPGVRRTDTGGFPNAELHGCFLSHLGVLRAARDAGLGIVMVAEDDLAFSTELAADEPVLLELLAAEEWDVVQLGWGDHGGSSGLATAGPLHLERYTGDLIGSHCYVVRGGFLPDLIAYFEDMAAGRPGDPAHGPMSPDGLLNVLPRRHPGVRRLVAVPSLVGQRPSASDVTPRWFDRIPGAQVPLRVARRAKRFLVGLRSR